MLMLSGRLTLTINNHIYRPLKEHADASWATNADNKQSPVQAIENTC